MAMRKTTKSWVKRATVVAAIMSLSACSMFSSKDPRYEPAPLGSYEAELSAGVRWSVSLSGGAGYGFAPHVVNNSAYAASQGGQVVKVDIASGRALWTTNVNKRLSAGVGADGNVVAVASSDGTVIALNDQGVEMWTAKAASEITVPPLVGGGIVAVRSTDYRIQAFDARTGDLLWSLQRPGPALALKTNIQMEMIDGLLISGMPNGRLMIMDAQSGAVQWEGTVAVSQGATDLERIIDVVGAPQLQGPLLCGAAYQGRIVCFDVSRGGVPVWDRDFSNSVGPASDGQFLYASDRRDIMHAFRLGDGAPVWKQEGLRNRKLSAPAVIPQAVAVGDFDGYVHFLSRSDGRLLGRVSVGGGEITSPLIGSDRGVLVQARNGNLVLVGVN